MAVYNVGGNVRFGIHETTSRVFFKVWEMCCLVGSLWVERVSRAMCDEKTRHYHFYRSNSECERGNGFSAFASGKHGLRALAQSMARELGPKGIHVGHVVIDGAIDTEWIKKMFPDRYAQKENDGILDPSAIAEAYWNMHCQPRNA